jgi:hypothetical protein
MTNELWETTMTRLPCGVNILKLSMAFVEGAGLLPTQASAQFGFPIPIPPFYLRPPGYHSAPSHHSSSRTKHEENNGSSAEKDATQLEPNASTSTEHQQQVSGPTRDGGQSSAKSNPSQNNADTEPGFAPSR